MKKLIYVCMTIFFMLGFKGTVFAATELNSDNYTYTVEDGYAIITGYHGLGGSIAIPGQIDGYTVLEIGIDAFYQNNNITEISMANTIKIINKGAFGSCSELKSVKTSSNLEFLGTGSFTNCKRLNKIILPPTLKIMESECFTFNPSLAEINVEPYGVQNGFYSINGILFLNDEIICYPGNKKGTDFVIPEFVTGIYQTAFDEAQNLTQIYIPASVEKLYSSAFSAFKNPVKIILKHEAVPIISPRAFNSLAPGSQIVCRNDAVRAAAEAAIEGTGVTAVIGGQVAATDLKVTSGSQITVEPGTTTQITWEQTPRNTTDNVIWTSSDPTGLTVEPYTGKVKAVYRGTYTVTGMDESGHKAEVNVVVPLRMDEGKIHTIDFETFDKMSGLDFKDAGIKSYDTNTSYVMRYEKQYSDWREQGIRPEETLTKEWIISGNSQIWEYMEDSMRLFQLYEPGTYTISYRCKDKYGAVIGKADKVITVLAETVVPTDISKCKVTLNGSYQFKGYSTYDYTGKEIKPQVTTDISSSNYTVSYERNVEPGIGYVIVTGRGSYTGIKRIPFYIRKDLSINAASVYKKTYGDASFYLNVKVSGDLEKALYYSTSNTKVVTVSQNGKVSIKGAGAAYITVKGTDNYTREVKTKKIRIEVKKGSLSRASIKKVSDQVYTGKTVKPAIRLSFHKKALKNKTDYTVSYKNNIKVGTATISIKGKGNFTGIKIVKFKIAGAARPSAFTQKTTGKTTTSSIQLTWKKVPKAFGYQVYRSASRKGAYKKIASITGGSAAAYTDKRLKSGTIYYYKIRAYRKISGKLVSGIYSDPLEASTKPAKPVLNIKSKNRTSILKWNKVKGASGYEIYRSTSKKGRYKKVKTILSPSIRTYSDKKVTADKRYYYKIRAYKTVNGKRIYGDSTVSKSIRVIR